MKYVLLVFIFASCIGCNTYLVKNATTGKIALGSQILDPNECMEYTAVFLGDSLIVIKTVADNPETIGSFTGHLGSNHKIVKEAQDKSTNEKVEITSVDKKPDCKKII